MKKVTLKMASCFITFGIIILSLSLIIGSALHVPTADDLDFYYFRDHFPKGNNKTVVIFGASGKIGNLVIQNCIAQGFNVTAYARNASKVRYHHKRVKIIQGELSDREKIREAIHGADAIISCLGPSYRHRDGTMPVYNGTNNIIKIAKEENVTRFINMASSTYRYDKDNETIYMKYARKITKTFFNGAFVENNHICQTTRYSGLNWTTIRFVYPTDKPARSRVYITYGEDKFEPFISRQDIALFAVCILFDNDFVGDMPIIGY